LFIKRIKEGVRTRNNNGTLDTKKMVKKNKLKELYGIELMCKGIISSIELHRMGIEDFTNVMIRLGYFLTYLEKIRNEGLELMKKDKTSHNQRCKKL